MQTLRLGWTLAERDLRTRYAHSVLGSLWSLAQPLAMATALFFVGKAWNRTISADLWLLGWVVWNVFSSSAFSGALSLAHNRELVTKTAIPAFSYPLSKAIVAAVDGAVGLVLWGIFAVVTGVHANATLAVGALFAFAASLAGGLGMGALLALPAARVRDVAVALPFLAQLGLLLSPLLLGTSTSFSEHLPWIPGWGPVQAVLTQSVGSDVGYLWATALLLLGMGFGVLKRWGKNAADWV
jgi:ABC-type polysaccharide/polyol phosphate export permease